MVFEKNIKNENNTNAVDDNNDDNNCIWCKDEESSSKILSHSIIPIEFLEKTKQGLYSCTECQDSYYRYRLKIKNNTILESFDRERLLYPLLSYLNDDITHVNSKFILTIYELLCYPYHLQTTSEDEEYLKVHFWKVIETLIERKKMIRSAIVLPGFFLFLYQNQTIQNWIHKQLPLNIIDSSMKRSSAIMQRNSIDFSSLFLRAPSTELKRIILYLPLKLSHHHLIEIISNLRGNVVVFSLLKNVTAIGDRALVIKSLFISLKEWDPSILRSSLRSFPSSLLLSVFEEGILEKKDDDAFCKQFVDLVPLLEKGDLFYNILLHHLLWNPSPNILSLVKSELMVNFTLNSSIHTDIPLMCRKLLVLYRRTNLNVIKMLLDRHMPVSSTPAIIATSLYIGGRPEGPPSKLQRLKMEYAEERRGVSSSDITIPLRHPPPTPPIPHQPLKNLLKTKAQTQDDKIDVFGPVIRHSSTVLLDDFDGGFGDGNDFVRGEKRLKSSTIMTPIPTTRHPLSVQEEIELLKYFHTKILQKEFPQPIKNPAETFHSHREYLQTMEPLIMAEALSQIDQSMQIDHSTTTLITSVIIENIRYDDSLIDIMTTNPSTTNTQSSFSEQEILELDGYPGVRAIVMLLSKGKGVNIHMLSKTIPPNLIRIGASLSFRRRVDLSSCSLITDWRQIHSLHNLRSSPFLSAILGAKTFNPTKRNDDDSLEQLNNSLNKSQVSALQTVKEMTPYSITLIQGPPGTGKTSTINALVSLLLTSSSVAKILICCPSNTAVDEIVRRISKSHGDIIRVGQLDSMADDVKAFSLDNLREHDSSNIEESNKSSIRELKERLEKTIAMPSTVQVEQRRKELEQKIRGLERNGKQSSSSSSYIEYLKRARVICTTLSGSGHEILSTTELGFQTLIVDEACQCVETLTLIPLRFLSIKKIILVGDPRQLPPTLINPTPPPTAKRSLFERLYDYNPNKSLMLNLQYRMHPQISFFPNMEFYSSLLGDSPNLLIDNSRSYHKNYILPFQFCNVKASKSSKKHSNLDEAEVLVEFLKFFIKNSPKGDSIGIITPYREQQRLIKERISSLISPQILEICQVMTVDGFQGQERDVILFSCVRSSGNANGGGGGAHSGIGFLKDERRLNVALTRAKSTLVVIGDGEYLASSGSPCWERFITYIKEKGHGMDWLKMYNSIKTYLNKEIISSYIENNNSKSIILKQKIAALPSNIPKKIISPLERRRK